MSPSPKKSGRRRQKLIAYLNGSANVVAALSEIIPELVDGLTDEIYGKLTLEVAAETTRNPAVRAAFERNEAELREQLSEALRRGQLAGHVAPQIDRDTTVFLLMALFDGIAGRAAFAPNVDKQALARGVVRLLVSMLAAPAVAPG